MNQLSIFLAVTLMSSLAMATVSLEKIRSFPKEDGFITELTFDSELNPSQAELEFKADSVLARISESSFAKKRASTFVNNKKRGLRFVEAMRDDNKTVIARWIFKDTESLDKFRDRIDIEVDGKILRLRIQDNGLAASVAKEDINRSFPLFSKEVQGAPPLRLTAGDLLSDPLSNSDKNGLTNAAAEVQRSEAKTILLKKEVPSSGSLAKNNEANANLSEEKIPIQLGSSNIEKTGTDPLKRLVLTIFLLFATIAISILFLRRAKKSKSGTTNDKTIKVLASHYLGPKRSMALVSVAGETMLVGITEQNISLIKSLALLEEEIPTHTSKSFSGSLRQAESDTNEEEEFAMSSLRDVVSKRLNSMGKM
jgi:flagellar protein FliO/FliZ